MLLFITVNFSYGAVSDNDNPFLNASIQEVVAEANKGNCDAQVVLGDKYAHGEGVAQDIMSAISWYEKAAKNGNGNAQKWLADSYYMDGNYKDALSWYEKNAMEGDSSSAHFTAKMYNEGKGTARDFQKAKQWYEKAALAGHGQSQYELGLILYESNASFEDYGESLKWLQKSLDDKEGTYQGNALYQIALIHLHNKNYENALTCFRRAALFGNEKAEYELGMIYKKGEMVSKDLIEAYKWFILSSDNNYQKAIAERGEIQKKLSREEFLEAQKKAHEFKMQAPSQTELTLSSGTGFFITSDGYLLTASHVMEKARQVQIKNKNGVFDAKIISANPSNDVALLKAEGDFTPIYVTSSRKVRLGAQAFTLGFPNISIQGMEPKFSKGEVGSLSGLKDNPRHFQVSVPVQPGNSGGPLVDEEGNVIGILVSKLADQETFMMTGAIPQNVNYAVKSSVILAFLEVWPEVLDKMTPPSGNESKTFQETVKNTEEAICIIFSYN